MGNFRVFIAFLVSWVALASTAAISSRADEYRLNYRQLALANNELAFNLHRLLVSGSSDNVFFSPFSISTAFGMLFHGARGSTAQELRDALGYEKAHLGSDFVHVTFKHYLAAVLQSGDSSNGNVFNTANAVLVDKQLELLEEYRRDVQEFYRADVRDVDFKTEAPRVVEEINDYVREKTNGKIEKLFDELSPDTVLLLLNAVYFKGNWKTSFEPEKTRDEVFYNNGLESEGRKVPMMHKKSYFPQFFSRDFQALELPYKGDNVSMIVFLPNNRDGLQDLEKNLTPEKLDEVLRQLYIMEVDVSLPKFKLQFEKELSPEVRDLGANQIFRNGANLHGITRSRNVFVSQVSHKAVIEVNELGSEAAAVTGVEVVPYSLREGKFRADHPFMFAIVEKGSKSNMVLFLGRVNEL